MKRVMAMGVVVLGLCMGMGVRAQTTVRHVTGPLPAFEVATVKPQDPKLGLRISAPGTTQQAVMPGTARSYVARAYGVTANSKMRVLGGPAWVEDNRYVIDAKIPDEMFAKMQMMKDPERAEQVNQMLCALLADRFKLKMHIETREMPIYELVVAKDGPKMEALAPTDMPGGEMSWGKGEVKAVGTLEGILQFPPFGLGGRPIVNKTGLTGVYRMTLKWDPPPMPGMNTPAGQGSAEEGAQPSIFTVIQEQMGLKLMPTKGPVEVIVIDSIERPTEN